MRKYNVTVAVIGEGLKDRMNSKSSKLLHCVCGKPMVSYAIEAAIAISESKPVLAASDDMEELQNAFDDSVLYAQIGLDELLPKVCLGGEGYIVVLNADMPLVCAEILELAVETAEEKDAGACIVMSEDEKADTSSIYCFDKKLIKEALEKGCRAFGECIDYFADNGYGVEAICSEYCDVVNDRSQIAKVSAKMRKRINENLMMQGVTMINPESTYIDSGVKIGSDTVIYPGVTIEGTSEVGQDCVLYPGSRISDSVIGSGTTVQNSVLLQAKVGDNTTIGPYAYLRPKTVVGDGCRVGDFVEVKNAHIKDGAKVSHLTYVGDGEIGEKSNIGCGVVFVNYDGKKKSRTVIGKNAFIGCNVNLVAPVEVEDGAFVAAGTTVTKNVEKDALCIGRSKQKNIEGWAKKWWEK